MKERDIRMERENEEEERKYERRIRRQIEEVKERERR